MPRRRATPAAGVQQLSPKRKWRAIAIATLILAPAFWAILAGLVSIASDHEKRAPAAGPYIAFGLCLIPFVFVTLAFLSEHPRAASAAAKAMVVSLLVGIPVSALAADAVTGLVAGVGAGGVVALRADLEHRWKARALAVMVASFYVFVMLRAASGPALIVAPALPFTAIGVADHLSERRRERTLSKA